MLNSNIPLLLAHNNLVKGGQATTDGAIKLLFKLVMSPAAEALQLFEEHVTRCQALVEEVQPRPGTDEQRATRPKYAAFKMAIMAVKAER